MQSTSSSFLSKIRFLGCIEGDVKGVGLGMEIYKT